MNRKEIGMIVQGSGVLAIVLAGVFVAKINPLLAVLAVVGIGAVVVSHFLKG